MLVNGVAGAKAAPGDIVTIEMTYTPGGSFTESWLDGYSGRDVKGTSGGTLETVSLSDWDIDVSSGLKLTITATVDTLTSTALVITVSTATIV